MSELGRDSPDAGVTSWVAEMDLDVLYLSAVTIGEVQRGIALLADGTKRRRLERWLAADLLSGFRNRILSFDGDVALRWGELRTSAEKAGGTLPILDAIIAATALSYGLAVVTRNEGDFVRSGARVFNPWSARHSRETASG
ncbi:MAG: type II toxin-antitoxin system VapC family toxin [Candidatus Eremiobacteraeota bacterium]|nr:type II toxin-antitoxin system VapC family toxin [Candidatus Eremiobacteraeota bacterium]MBC5802299.1 type II toxin-antitoxin system VapC family toxin [Candidatus Eremiobacteraeota bacterium]